MGAFIAELVARDSAVMAVSKHGSVLLALFPVFSVGMPVVAAVCRAYRNRIPLFGNPDTQYGAPDYPGIYPLFFSKQCVGRSSWKKPPKHRTYRSLVPLVLMTVRLLAFPLRQGSTLRRWVGYDIQPMKCAVLSLSRKLFSMSP